MSEEFRRISVTYLVSNEDYERLQKIFEEYKKQDLDQTPEQIFANIMCCGSKYDVDEKLKFHEWKLGLRASYK